MALQRRPCRGCTSRAVVERCGRDHPPQRAPGARRPRARRGRRGGRARGEAPSPGRRAPAGRLGGAGGLRRARVRAARRRRRDLPSGTFVFVLSDFLAPPPDRVWIEALARRWDVVPVVIQDPVWERASRRSPAWSCRCGSAQRRGARRAAARARGAAPRGRERRASGALLHGLRALTLDPVLLETDDAERIAAAFTAWAAARVARRRGDERAPPAGSAPRRPRRAGRSGRRPQAADIAVAAQLAPRPLLFGAHGVARVTVIVDARRVDVDSIRITAPLAPLTTVAASTRRHRAGDLVRVTWSARSCATATPACPAAAGSCCGSAPSA